MNACNSILLGIILVRRDKSCRWNILFSPTCIHLYRKIISKPFFCLWQLRFESNMLTKTYDSPLINRINNVHCSSKYMEFLICMYGEDWVSFFSKGFQTKIKISPVDNPSCLKVYMHTISWQKTSVEMTKHPVFFLFCFVQIDFKGLKVAMISRKLQKKNQGKSLKFSFCIKDG